jgi:hypothetical protein
VIKPMLLSLAAGMLLAGAVAAQKTITPPTTFTGEVMDSACARAGSHDAMMKMKKSGAADAKECTQKCVQAGASYVLFNPTNKIAYQFDDQQKAAEFAGQTVRVTGTVDMSSHIIHASDIVPGS